MKRIGKIAVCLVTGMMFSAALCSSAASSNPYEPIVTRNIFNLTPPNLVNNKPKLPEPPSKITVDGLMTIFGGKPQAVYKVAVPAHPPHPATVKHYILGEGQEQDDIEVKHIDMKTGLVTFDNHGIEQQIPLTKAGPISTPTPVVMNMASNPHGAPTPGHMPPNLAERLKQLRNSRNYRQHFGNNQNSGNTTGSFGSTSGANTGSANQPKLTPDEQMLVIAAEKAHAKDQGNPMWKLYPPTPADQDMGTVNTAPPAAPGANASPSP